MMMLNIKQKWREGGAVLVVSLVMLAVVTFLIIAYLAFAQRDRTSVNMSIIQTQNRFLLETGRAHAQAKVKELVDNNLNYQLEVSQNMDGNNPQMLNPALFKAENMVLKEKARVPVFHDRNGNGNAFEIDDEFRYHLNLNRDEGVAPDAIHPYRGGDPHWVGVLENPDSPHGPKNRFIGRYAYMIVPASKTLDLNHMHNNAKKPGEQGDWYRRGRGDRYSDLNLAGALGVLNPQTQPWPYIEYSATDQAQSQGSAFGNAALLFDYKRQQHIGSYTDIFDLFKPSQIKKNGQGLNYDGFTRLLGKTGKTAFYELAGSISTREQPPPTGLLNLNQYIPVVSNIRNSNFKGYVILEKPVGWGAGARVCIYSNNGVKPRVRLLNAPVPEFWDVRPGEIFYAKVSPDSKNTVMLYRDSGPGSENDKNNQVEIMPAPPRTVFRLDRSLEMFEEVAARLLKARANSKSPIISKDIVSVTEGDRPNFNISVWRKKHNGLDPLPNLPQHRVGDDNTPDQKEYKLQYSLEVERLLQVAANIVDVYTPEPYPSVFRPVYARSSSMVANESGVKSPAEKWIIRHFTKEPNDNFLDYDSVSSENIATPMDRVNEVGHGGDKEIFNMPLIIGAKNRWGGGNHLTPAINEISTRWIMKAGNDGMGSYMQPQMQALIEIKDNSGVAEGMDLHVNIKKIEGIIYSYRTPNELAGFDSASPSSFVIPEVDEVIRISTKPSPWVPVPKDNPKYQELVDEYKDRRFGDWGYRGYRPGEYVRNKDDFYYCNMTHKLARQPTQATVTPHSGGFW